MKNALFLALIILTLNGCDNTSKEYKAFVKKYGSNTRVFCDKDGFKMRETFLYKNATSPREFLIDAPRCK